MVVQLMDFDYLHRRSSLYWDHSSRRSEHRVILLEYLKQLRPIEWENFVKDTMILAKELAMFNGVNHSANNEKGQSKADNLPFCFMGFKSAAPQVHLCTRIWASLRAQTLYRTVYGMMNYSRAIKLLYRVENLEVVQLFGGNTDRLERELENGIEEVQVCRVDATLLQVQQGGA